MACTPAPACKAALAEATRIAPNRNRASDGVCASPQHTQANPTSDHETGDAFDLTHDPVNGCNVDLFFDYLIRRRDPRVKYLIRNSRILRSYDKPGIPAWTWAPYSGSNPHTKHGHCSIVAGARNMTAPWFGATTQQEDEFMPKLTEDEQRELLQRVRDIHGWASTGTVERIMQTLEKHVADPGTGGGPGGIDRATLEAELRDELAKLTLTVRP